MPTKSFRGMMKTDQVDTIPLATRDGSTGYKITKMQKMQQHDIQQLISTTL